MLNAERLTQGSLKVIRKLMDGATLKAISNGHFTPTFCLFSDGETVGWQTVYCLVGRGIVGPVKWMKSGPATRVSDMKLTPRAIQYFSQRWSNDGNSKTAYA
jgi:hypothetical protein